MMNKRLTLFLGALTLMMIFIAGCVYWTNDTAQRVCPPGQEATREYTPNKTRKLICKKVEEPSHVEN